MGSTILLGGRVHSADYGTHVQKKKKKKKKSVTRLCFFSYLTIKSIVCELTNVDIICKERKKERKYWLFCLCMTKVSPSSSLQTHTYLRMRGGERNRETQLHHFFYVVTFNVILMHWNSFSWQQDSHRVNWFTSVTLRNWFICWENMVIIHT